ncbi:ATP-dependent translocase ABCB1, partial [Lamellibrachia satsuma]
GMKGEGYHSNLAFEPDAVVDTMSTEVKGENDEEKEKKEEKPPMVTVKDMFRFATKGDAALMITGILCAIIHGCAMQLLIIIFGDMIDSFVINAKDIPVNYTVIGMTEEYAKDHPNEFGDALVRANLSHLVDDAKEQVQQEFMSKMSTFAIYYVVVAAAVLVFAYGQVAFWILSASRQTEKVRISLLTAILKQDIGWFDTHAVGELNTRLTDDVGKFQEGISNKMSNFFQYFTTFVLGFILGFVYGWKLSLVILAVSPLLVISGIFMTYMVTGATTKELKAYAKAGAVAEEVISSIRTVVAFGGEKKECDRYGANLTEAKAHGIRMGTVSAVGVGLMFFIMFCVYSLAFWYGSKLVREEDMTAGNMIIVSAHCSTVVITHGQE